MAKARIPVLDQNEYFQVQLLTNFIDVLQKGMVKPYDPSHFIQKISKLEKDGHDVSWLKQCCPPSSEIHDVIDLKEYILRAADRVADILEL